MCECLCVLFKWGYSYCIGPISGNDIDPQVNNELISVYFEYC